MNPPRCPDCKTAADYQHDKNVGGVCLQSFECCVCESQLLQDSEGRVYQQQRDRLDAIGAMRAIGLPDYE